MNHEEWIDSGDAHRWAAALDGVPHGYWHSSVPCQAASANTGLAVRLYVGHTGSGKVVCPVMERKWQEKSDLATPIGISGFASSTGTYPGNFPESWTATLASKEIVCIYLAQHPLYAPVWPRETEVAGSTLYLLDLVPTPREWLQKIDANRRRSILAWERQECKWVRDRQELTEFVVRHHGDFMRSVSASDASYLSAEALQTICNDAAVELVGAIDDKGICTTAAFGSTSYGSELLFHISIRKGRSFTAALMWWAVQHYHGKAPFLSLGGTPRENDSLADAKRRYRPRETPFRKLKIVVDHPKYAALCIDARVAGDLSSGYFPPYRRFSAGSPGPIIERSNDDAS
jgi:hypothetical protein